ncbi:MAG: site-specific DNA-methyltransferase [Syntrophorhabdus sp.]
MANSRDRQKLELTWIGKENRLKLEPSILLEDGDKSYRRPEFISGPNQKPISAESEMLKQVQRDIFNNRRIFGDNLLALKALEQEFAGKVKCIFIDPPYNTGSAFTHYDDGLEHSIWLSLMRDRLELLRDLLSDNGSIWITIDDNEAYYLKVLCDEVFGRNNFVTSICWQKIHSLKNDARVISANHDFILLYAKNISFLKLNLLARTKEMDSRYKNPDRDPR